MAKNLAQNAGKEAIEKLGWWRAHRFLVLRRLCQLTIIALFMAGPTLGVLTGNLSSSMLLDTVPLSDPLIVLQALATGHIPEFNTLLGVVIVVVFYAILAPRAFCFGDEATLGRPASHGCIHVAARDLLPLFDRTRVGTLVWIDH